jgi:carboxyl-terminal processing protease
MSFADTQPAPGPEPQEPLPEPLTLPQAPPDAAPAVPARRSIRVRGTLPFRIALLAVVLLGGGTLFMSGYSLGRGAATTPGTPVSEDRAFQPFWDTYRAITDHYAGGDVDRKSVIDGAIKGMIDALGDPYSGYMTPEDFARSLQGLSGQFEGIGATVAGKSTDGKNTDCTPLGPVCALTVVQPIAGAPADKAGIQAGDRIAKVDGTSVDGLTIDAAIARVRGPKGTAVTLTMTRGAKPAFDVKITREVIVQKEVVAKDLAAGTVGYLQVTGFSEQAASDFQAALKRDVDAGQKKIIVDLRSNPGGYVTAARRIASQFIGSGPIFWEQGAHTDPVATNAEPGGVATDPSIQVVVLVNKGSASASEIVAGALQDTGRAKLVGETTFGKGTIQEWQTLEDNNGGFRLTIAKWLTPKQRWINHVGLIPDIPVTVPANQPAGSDPVLDAALKALNASSASAPSLRIAA